MLLPPSLDELIDKKHPVRLVDHILDQIDIKPLMKLYKGGGASSYHPRMLLKVLVYAYLCNIFSSRKIEEALSQNIHFMWISGMSRPDHNTISRFRSNKLSKPLKEIFSKIVLLLSEQGLISLKEVYTDGTKIEADANKYTFVWAKSIKHNRERIAKQLDELWQYAQDVAAEEMKDAKPVDFATASPEAVRETIEQIDKALKDKDIDPKVRQKVSYAKKNWPDKLEQYERQEQTLQGRNSCSKTDPDATFMRMKDDVMNNGQLKAGYNLQISTNDQYVVNYTIHSNPTDTLTLPAHLDNFYSMYKCHPQALCADAGYGSEQNYHYLQTHSIEGYVKYNYFHKEQRSAGKDTDKLTHDSFYYNAAQDCYYCPMGQRMERIAVRKEVTDTGFEKQLSVYKAVRCEGCPLRGACYKGQGPSRVMEVNHRLLEYKHQARQRLTSEAGIAHRKKRCCDVEPVFGQWKSNRGYDRYRLRGKGKVEIETGLLAISHNLSKMSKAMKANAQALVQQAA